MTNETLENLINKLNIGKSLLLRSFNQIGNSNIYLAEYDINDNNSAYQIYMIKNEKGKFVSAVLDMQPLDLHWYTLLQYRRKGYLKKALKNWIVPDLCEKYKKQETIKISIESYFLEEGKISLNLAKSIGFTQISKNELIYQIQ